MLITVGDYIVYGEGIYRVIGFELERSLITVDVPADPLNGWGAYEGQVTADSKDIRKATDVEIMSCKLRGTNELD